MALLLPTAVIFLNVYFVVPMFRNWAAGRRQNSTIVESPAANMAVDEDAQYHLDLDHSDEVHEKIDPDRLLSENVRYMNTLLYTYGDIRGGLGHFLILYP